MSTQTIAPFNCNQFYRNTSASNYRPNIDADVTDNKTPDLIKNLLSSKPKYVMNDIFHREDERLKTFAYWPLEWLDKNTLATTGVYYTGEDDKVKCYFCEVEIGRWEENDHPVTEHLRWSPNCPLLRRRTTNNVPLNIDALDRLLPAISYDICGSNDAIEVRPLSYPEGTIRSTAVEHEFPSVCMASSSSCGNIYPQYPEYAIESARLRSFAEWPRHMKQKPEQLAEAGFFYTGTGDRVKCFSCGGGLKDWDDSDEPWEQHALWLAKCHFLKLIKGDKYIEDVTAQHKAKEAEACSSSDESEHVAAISASGEAELETSVPRSEASSSSQEAAPLTLPKDSLVKPTNFLKTSIPLDASLACLAHPSTSSNSTAVSPNIPEEKLCKICYAGEYNTAFLPCGHVVACAKCASSVTKCPLCRKPFTDVMRVYFS